MREEKGSEGKEEGSEGRKRVGMAAVTDGKG